MATTELHPAFDPELQPIGYALAAELFPGRHQELAPGLFDEQPTTPTPEPAGPSATLANSSNE